MTDRKVYAKKDIKDWGFFWFLVILSVMIHAGMIVQIDIYMRLVLAVISLAIYTVIVLGIVVQTSVEKEVEIGYIKEARK